MQGHDAHVIEYFVALAGVVRGEQLQIFVLHSSAALVQQHLSFVEIAECDTGFAITVMDNTDIIIREGAVDVSDDFIWGHFFQVRLDIREVQQLDGLFPVILVKLLLGLVKPIDQLQVQLVIFVDVVFAFSCLF